MTTPGCTVNDRSWPAGGAAPGVVGGAGGRLAKLARLFGQAAMVGLKRGQGVRLLPLV